MGSDQGHLSAIRSGVTYNGELGEEIILRLIQQQITLLATLAEQQIEMLAALTEQGLLIQDTLGNVNKELKVMNMHLALMTDVIINKEELQ